MLLHPHKEYEASPALRIGQCWGLVSLSLLLKSVRSGLLWTSALKFLLILPDRHSLSKVRMFIKIDRLTGRYFQVLPLPSTFARRQL